MELTLEQWIAAMRAELAKFEEFYTWATGDDPDNFPQTMPQGEWDEQFLSWQMVEDELS